MKALDPVLVIHEEAGLTLTATEAGRTQSGLCATVQAQTGDDVQVARRVKLAAPDDRLAFAKEVASQTGAGSDAIESALVAALEPIEAAMRDGAHHATQTEKLLSIVADKIDLCHDPEEATYAKIQVGGHHEVHPIRSIAMKRYLQHIYYEAEKRPPGPDAVRQVIATLDAQARYAAHCRPVFLRVGGNDGRVYVDLGDALWSVVEVDCLGWRILGSSPVWFRRSPGMLPLPEPRKAANVAGLFAEAGELLNLSNDRDLRLTIGWLLSALVPEDQIQYPVRIDQGRQGSGKSTRARLLRSVVDPSSIPVRSAPREERDLVIAAKNSRVLALDNLSGLPDWLSDGLCRLSTGGGFGTRALYENDAEALFAAKRPIQVNGIDTIATRPDLIDRSILTTSDEIPPKKRRPESQVVAAFDALRPQILGALLEALACALRRRPSLSLGHLPRMADFAEWVTAAEPALGWSEGTLLSDYYDAQSDAVSDGLDADPLAAAIINLMDGRMQWTGTATGLLWELCEAVSEATQRLKVWPKGANALTGRINRLAPALRSVGIEANQDRSAKSRTWTLDRLEPQDPQLGEEDRHDRHRSHQSTGGGHLGDDDSGLGNGAGDGPDTYPRPGGTPPIGSSPWHAAGRASRVGDDNGDGQHPPKLAERVGRIDAALSGKSNLRKYPSPSRVEEPTSGPSGGNGFGALAGDYSSMRQPDRCGQSPSAHLGSAGPSRLD